MSGTETKLLDRLRQVAADGKGKDPAAVLKEMGQILGGGSGRPKASAAFIRDVRQLARDVKGRQPGAGNGQAPPPSGPPPPAPEGTVVKLEGGKTPDGATVGADKSFAGGVPAPGGRALPRQVSDPALKRDLQQQYKDETTRYLSRERVPAEYRELIRDYFSY